MTPPRFYVKPTSPAHDFGAAGGSGSGGSPHRHWQVFDRLYGHRCMGAFCPSYSGHRRTAAEQASALAATLNATYDG